MNIVYTPQQNSLLRSWKVIEEGGKFICLGSPRTEPSIHNTILTRDLGPVLEERYEFQTLEFASACCRLCADSENANYPMWTASALTVTNGGVRYAGYLHSTQWLTNFSLNGKVVLSLEADTNKVISFDLIEILKIWVGLLPVGSFFQRLLWGTNGRKHGSNTH